jgi:predicted patatin/cPLA2 family phospholipase
MKNNFYKESYMIDCGLVLEGGGLRGNYPAGVLDSFLDAGIEFPYIIGVSAGVGMGCSYVSKQKGRNLKILTQYRNDSRYLSFRSFIKTGNYFGLDFIYDEIPRRLILFDFEIFNQYQGRFISVCTDCETGEAIYYDKEEDVLTVMKASSAIPFISKMVLYKNKKLLDGAIVDAIPLAKSISDGNKKNVVILTNPIGFCKREEHQPPATLMYRKYPKLVDAMKHRIENYNLAMGLVEHEEKMGNTFVIRPSIDLGVTRMEKSMEKLKAIYQLGIDDGKAAAEKIREF